MNAIMDFIRAAAPWVAMGLAVAILAARGVSRKKKGKKADGDYGTEGMCLGMCFGLLAGNLLENVPYVLKHIRDVMNRNQLCKILSPKSSKTEQIALFRCA